VRARVDVIPVVAVVERAGEMKAAGSVRAVCGTCGGRSGSHQQRARACAQASACKAARPRGVVATATVKPVAALKRRERVGGRSAGQDIDSRRSKHTDMTDDDAAAGGGGGSSGGGGCCAVCDAPPFAPPAGLAVSHESEEVTVGTGDDDAPPLTTGTSLCARARLPRESARTRGAHGARSRVPPRVAAALRAAPADS
jgi:hypothetical protein